MISKSTGLMSEKRYSELLNRNYFLIDSGRFCDLNSLANLTMLHSSHTNQLNWL